MEYQIGAIGTINNWFHMLLVQHNRSTISPTIRVDETLLSLTGCPADGAGKRIKLLLLVISARTINAGRQNARIKSVDGRPNGHDIRKAVVASLATSSNPRQRSVQKHVTECHTFLQGLAGVSFNRVSDNQEVTCC